MEILVQIIILIMSVVIHEVAHGFAALRFGDETALRAGRLTMNPLKHLDPIGSVILPILLVVLKSPIGFGWAKPVPYNPIYFKNIRLGTRVVAFAGILANLGLALIFGLVVRFLGNSLSQSALYICMLIVLTNLGLALFNLVPIPPLDGSKILFSVLPRRFERYHMFLEQNGFVFVLAFLILLNSFNVDPLTKGVVFLFKAITGAPISL
jgi:Zn-dependent protease